MATQTVTRKRSVSDRRGRRVARLRWWETWPLLLAIAATPFAVKTAEILPLMGLAGLHRLCLLLPFVVLMQHLLHTSDWVLQAVMYGQFPAYGLLLIALQAWKTVAAGIISIVFLHLIAAAAAWLLLSGMIA